MHTRSGPQTVETEIERKFLLRSLPHHLPLKGRVLESAYLSVRDPEVRIARYRGHKGSYQITVKGGAGISRTEAIIDISDEVGDSIWAMTDPATRLRKTRGWFPGGWEVDFFEGNHRGLLMAEIELVHEDSPLPAIPEGMVLGPEVTYDARFKNKALSEFSRAQLTLVMNEMGVPLESAP
jgi:CYTH domain-containing protein